MLDEKSGAGGLVLLAGRGRGSGPDDEVGTATRPMLRGMIGWTILAAGVDLMLP